MTTEFIWAAILVQLELELNLLDWNINEKEIKREKVQMKPWHLKEEKLQCKCLKCANHRTRICNPSRKKAEQSTYAQTWNHYVNAGKKV